MLGSQMARNRILVVEDSRFIRTDIVRMLVQSGYDVLSAGDGLEAIALLRSGEIVDAVTLDVAMPRLGGFETCARIRSHALLARSGEPLPVLFRTSKDSLRERRKGFAVGGTDFILKNSIRTELISTLGDLVDPPIRLDGVSTMVVMPDSEVGERLGTLLSSAGAQVKRASSGAEARYRVASGQVWDLVLIAAQLADQASGALVRELRQHEDFAATIIFGVAQPDERGVAVSLLRAGASDYIATPFSREELLFRVHMHTSRLGSVAAPIEANPAVNAEQEPDGPLQVLFAEDSMISGTITSALLRGAGHHVQWVKHGAAAVDAFRERAEGSDGGFDVVLTDLEMPELGGMDASSQIRAIELELGMPRTPIAALTASHGDRIEALCAEAGIDRVLPKQFGVADLLELVQAGSAQQRKPVL